MTVGYIMECILVNLLIVCGLR